MLDSERSLTQRLMFPAPSLAPGEIQHLSPTALAYLGDAVYELYIRQTYLLPAKRIQTYHQHVVGQVRAETQAQYLALLLPHLTDTEMDWVRRGRNATGGRPKRLAADIYQQATSLETLVGYLYLTNPSRLMELFQHLTTVAPDFRASDRPPLA